MKKRVLLIAAIFVAGSTFAQDMMTSKKGTPILPEAGDYALGFNANQLTSYFGNLANGNAGNGIGGFNLPNGNALTIYGKQFTAADKAYRGMVRLGFGSQNFTTLVPDAAPNAAAGATVENDSSITAFNITVGGGIEMRRGKGRLQGVYGPMAMITFGTGNNTELTYGNDLPAGSGASRVIERKSGSTFGINVGGFAGVEYFFAPKMSIGGEIMWTINFTSNGSGETVTEVEGASNVTNETGSSSNFSLDTRPMGSLTVNFHF